MKKKRARSVGFRSTLIFLGTWMSLLIGVTSLVVYLVYLPDIALTALALAGCALSLSIRCYGILTLKAGATSNR